MRAFERLAAIVALIWFAWVTTHRERYGVSRYGAAYGFVALAVLALLYVWAWHDDLRKRKTARIAKRRSDNLQAQVALYGREPPESKSVLYPPEKI